jgi:HTH-type transcriptional regulator, sugar sensing transcriptional regulator
MPFQADLKKLGLSDKEADVYEASLELGEATVQQIAQKSKVARATTYLILDSLMKRGLVSDYEHDDKTKFIAESPTQLKRLLDRQEEELRDRQADLGRLLPKLQAFIRSSDQRPVVRYFSGVEGLKTMRGEMAQYSTSKDTWYSLTPLDHLRAVFNDEGDDYYTYANTRAAKGIQHKVIFTTASDKLRRQRLMSAREQRAERRFVPPEKFRSSSGMTIFRDRIAIATFTGHVGGAIIESPSAALMMRELFLLAWDFLE